MPAPEEALTARNVMFTGADGARSTPTRPSPPATTPAAGSSSSITCRAGTRAPRRSRGASPPVATTPSARTSTPARGSMSIPTTPRPPRGRPAGSPTSSSWATPGRHRGAAGAPHLQREGRGHRLLLGRPALLPHCGEPARRCGGRLLRGVRDRHRSRRLPAQGDPAGRPHPGPRLPAARPLRQRRPVPEPRAGGRAGGGAEAAGKTYEFHRYDGAGHAFFSVDRPAYRPEAAVDGWQRIFDWYGRYLAGG